MNYRETLTRLETILKEREISYGDARESHERIARRWNAVLNQRLSSDITGYDVARMMVELKLARLDNAGVHEDSLMDAANYLVIALRLGVDDASK